MSLKEFTFGATTTAGSKITATYSDVAIQGEIVKLVLDGRGVKGTNDTGSIYVLISGPTNEQVAIFKGAFETAPIVQYPTIYGNLQDNSTTGSPQVFYRPIINGPLVILGSALGSSKTLSGLTVIYRSI